MLDRNAAEQETKQNYDAFQRLLPSLLQSDEGKVALLRSGNLVAICATPLAALRRGEQSFPDGLFSIQPIIEENEAAEAAYFANAVTVVPL
jgi:hypothetical protein